MCEGAVGGSFPAMVITTNWLCPPQGRGGGGQVRGFPGLLLKGWLTPGPAPATTTNPRPHATLAGGQGGPQEHRRLWQREAGGGGRERPQSP